MHNVQGGQESN